MSLLPQQMPPYTAPLGNVQQDGSVEITKDYWLFLYNLALQILGNGQGFPADDLQDLESADMDAVDANAVALRQPIANVQKLVTQTSDYVPSSADLPDIARALLLAQDSLLPDPNPQAQPAFAVTPTGSPFTWTAPYRGTLSVTGGTVSLIQIIRQTTTVATGLTAGLIPVSRGDQVQITYSSVPTAEFLPT